MPKILILSPKARGIGGIAQHVSALARRLRGLGFTVRLVSSENTPIVPVRGLRNASYALTAALRVALRKYDIVHAHNVPAAIPMRAARGRRILTVHGVYSEGVKELHGGVVGALGAKLERAAVGWADVVTAVSRSAVEYYRKLGVNAVYVPNAVELSELPREGVRPYSEPCVVYVGRLSREKGVDVLVESFKLVRSRARLLVIGDGPMRRYLERVADERVSFLGYLPRSEALRYVKGADVFVLPSRTEGLSTALLEAMALGTPVVATSVGGNVELVEDGRTGLLVPPGDREALASAIERLLGDAEYAQTLAENAARVVREKYSWDVVIGQYLDVYGLG